MDIPSKACADYVVEIMAWEILWLLRLRLLRLRLLRSPPSYSPEDFWRLQR